MHIFMKSILSSTCSFFSTPSQFSFFFSLFSCFFFFLFGFLFQMSEGVQSFSSVFTCHYLAYRVSNVNKTRRKKKNLFGLIVNSFFFSAISSVLEAFWTTAFAINGVYDETVAQRSFNSYYSMIIFHSICCDALFLLRVQQFAYIIIEQDERKEQPNV